MGPIMEISTLNDFTPTVNLKEGQTLQLQFNRYLLQKIENGTLLPGTKLPPSRTIARELGISRNTVTSVLDQLKAEGYLTSQPGSGVFVNAALPIITERLSKSTWASKTQLPGLSSFGKDLRKKTSKKEERLSSNKSLPFTPGVPDKRAFPEKIWERIHRVHNGRIPLKGYDCNQGYLPLRKALANYLRLSRGVNCNEHQIIITQGAQQAITLCALLLLNQNDKVLMENPGYPNARHAFLTRQTKLIALNVSSSGIDVENLPPKTNAKLMYTTPTHQYPLGGILSASQRLRLLDWAAARNVWIIEDDYDSEFHFHGKPIASIQGMAKRTPVIYIGSFSKTIYPSIRLGYMVVPSELVSTFTEAKTHLGGESPLLTQAVVADFISEGHFIRHLRKMRLLYQNKWDHMQELVNRHLPSLATPIAESAGMHLALRINTKSDLQLENAFQKLGYGSTALSSYYFESPVEKGLVLGFACTNHEERILGIKALRKLIISKKK